MANPSLRQRIDPRKCPNKDAHVTDGCPTCGLVMDYPTAWAFVRALDAADHHEQCSWRSTHGAFLCDCDVLNAEYDRRKVTANAT